MSLDWLAVIKAAGLAFIASIVIAVLVGLSLGILGFILPEAAYPILGIVVFALGTTSYLLCGYLAAAFSDHKPYIHASAAIVFYLIILFLLSYAFPGEEEGISWSDGLHYSLTLPLSLAGAWLHERMGG